MLADHAEPVLRLVAVFPAALPVDDLLQQLVHGIDTIGQRVQVLCGGPREFAESVRNLTEAKPAQRSFVVAHHIVEPRGEVGHFAQRRGQRAGHRRDCLDHHEQFAGTTDALRQRADARVDLVEPRKRCAQSQPEREVLLRLVGQVM